jgi:hypothetical protein
LRIIGIRSGAGNRAGTVFISFVFHLFSLQGRNCAMKIAGVDPKTLPTEEVLVLPRGDKTVVFRAVGLEDMEGFKKLCPEPTPPSMLTKDGYVPDTKDTGYQSVLAEYSARRLAYMVVYSLMPSQIEWDTVQLDNPATWIHWEDDLKAAGFPQVVCNRVLGLVFEANCLDEAKLQKAREVFLQGPPRAAEK